MRSSFSAAPAAPHGSVMVDERSLSPPAMRLRALSIERLGPERAIELVGLAPSLSDALTKLEKVARYREPVLITGESGAGKEFFAQAVHLFGGARHAPFVPVNCPQYQEGNLTVSELFGHTRGSFTGAIADRKGAFEEADGGVIFLDEIADLHASAQVMLLRALATGEFRPVGRDPLAQRRRPGGVGDQPAAEPAGDAEPVPLRPAVPVAPVPHQHPGPARARRRLAPARRLLARPPRPPVRRRQAILGGVAARARAPRLAGQRPPAHRCGEDRLRDGGFVHHRAGRLLRPARGVRTRRGRRRRARRPTSASSTTARSSGRRSTKPS